MFRRQDEVWANCSNGNHGRDYYNSSDEEQTLAFLDHFVRGVGNGFETKVAHLSVGMDTAIDRNGQTNAPAWSITRDSLKLRVAPETLFFHAGGAMSGTAPPANGGSDSYAYPMPSPDVTEPGPTEDGRSMGQFTWKAPVPPGGSVAYTTPPLTKDAIVAGPA